MDMGVGSMKEKSERNKGKEDKRENKLGNSDVKEEYNRNGGCSSYMGSIRSVEGISTTSEVFSDREVSMIKRMILEQKKERKDNIVIKGENRRESRKGMGTRFY